MSETWPSTRRVHRDRRSQAAILHLLSTRVIVHSTSKDRF